MLRCRLCDSIYIGKRKILGNHSPPTVSAKFYFSQAHLLYPFFTFETILYIFFTARVRLR